MISFPRRHTLLRNPAAGRGLALALALGLVWTAPGAIAHEATFEIDADKLKIRTDQGKSSRTMSFKAKDAPVVRVNNHDPRLEPTKLLIRALGAKTLTSGLIELEPSSWKEKRNDADELVAYVYKDSDGSQGGITKASIKNGKIAIKAKGRNWPLKPKGDLDEVWVHFWLEEEQYCARFGEETSGSVPNNRKGYFQALDTPAPGACPDSMCGNGVQDLGEECDDGNLDDDDGCTRTCELACDEVEYDTTYAAIQAEIFDNPTYGCTNGICHDADAPQGGLDLTEGSSWQNLVGVTASIDPGWVRVFEADIDQSLLYQKLLEKKLLEEDPQNADVAPGSAMPSGTSEIVSDTHLDGLATWIRAGAPEDGVVPGTAEKFGACLGETTVFKITPPDPPGDGEGVQLISTAWPLPAQSEGEICMASFYDFTATDLVPEAAKVECPSRFEFDPDEKICQGDLFCLFNCEEPRTCTEDADCGEQGPCTAARNAVNPGGECFAWNAQELVQDPQSHHSIVYLYAGSFDETFEGWGPWTYKFDDPDDPRNGTPCDPADIDPELGLGYNPGCSGRAVDGVACQSTHVPDMLNFNIAGGGDDGTLPQFSGSQEAYYELTFADGVYTELPMRGIVVWNSHAFNLTDQDTTMNQYLNLEFAQGEAERRYQSSQLFDAEHIFTQYVEPFTTEEYCATFTLPQYAKLFRLSSHMHERGTLWRTWAPPNNPCKPDCRADKVNFGFIENCSSIPLPVCDGPPDRDPIYTSSVYNDPLQLDFPTPIAHDSASIADRTYLYCTVYDNGSTPEGPKVKTFSGSPQPPLPLPGLGGPCSPNERACMAGPNKGELCDDRRTGVAEETFCETKAGRGDGVCDACPLRGGVTTLDEMMILLGNFYVEPPGP